MSYGLVICSSCKREVHQTGRIELTSGRIAKWIHCEDSSSICGGNSIAIYPKSKEEIVGKFCGRDDLKI